MNITWRLLQFLRPFTGWVLLSITFSLATIAAGIGLLGTSAYVISRAALHPSIAVLQVAIVGVRFFGVARGVFRYLERLTTHSVNFQLLAQLRAWVYRMIEPLVPAAMPGISSGDLLNRVINDVDTLENFYVRVVSPYVAAGITIIGMGLFIGQFDLWLGLILFAGMLLCGLFIPLAALKLGKGPGERIITTRANWSGGFVESLQGISDLAVFNRTGTMLKKLADMNQDLGKAQIHQVRGGAWVNATNSLAANLTMAGVLWAAIPLVTNGRLEGFLLPVIVMLVLASFEAVTPLALAAHVHSATRQAGKRLFELESCNPLVAPPPAPLPVKARQHTITVRGLSFKYREDDPAALHNIDIQLQPGKKLAVVGPSGGGKSTLINLLLRLWDFSEGQILLDGEDVRLYDADELRRLFTVIAQSTYIFNASVRQNLKLAQPDAADDDLVKALEQAGLGEWLLTLPKGLDTWVGEHGLRLSGGERQRLAVARALLRDTPFVVLDEPTANLDTATEAALVTRLLSLLNGKSVLWITHRLIRMECMDEIILLDGGRIAERGTHEILIKQGGLYARLWELQNRMLPLTSSSPQSSSCASQSG